VSALIFDCDGTLADTMPAHYRAWVEILRPHGIAFPEARFYSMGGMPTGKIVEKLFSEREGSRRGDADSAKGSGLHGEARRDSPHREGRRGRPPRSRGAHGRGLGRTPPHGRADLAPDRNPRLVSRASWPAEDTTRHKPEPDVFLEAARRLGVARAECTVYEDTDLGIEAARRAGMRWVDVRTM
jgi:beta-phosphoglucomutase-like phosphatase (HAD superfamily)